MSVWSETEFQRVAAGTKLSERTLAACRDVLVDGLPGSEVARKHHVFQSQISRSIGLLQKRQLEIVENASALYFDTTAFLKAAVLQIAKHAIGDNFDVQDASPGRTYEGPILVNSHGFLVQRVGRTGILHDAGALERIPTSNAAQSITYPRDGVGKASVSEVLPAQETAVGIGR